MFTCRFSIDGLPCDEIATDALGDADDTLHLNCDVNSACSIFARVV